MEIWKEITGFESFEASSLGRIRSKRHGIKKPDINHAGYLRVGLWKNGKRYMRRVNRLIAIEFVPNPDNLPEVNHDDGDKLNNAAPNLRWCSRKFNMNHAVQTGLHKGLSGEANKASRFKEDDIRQIRLLREKGLSLSQIGAKYGAARTVISRIVNRQAWAHI